jgi:WXG100 family type VII secretion target
VSASFSYSVDVARAREVVSSLAVVESSLAEVVGDLRWRVAHLQALWQGEAALAHLDAHRAWSAAYDDMHEALAAMRRAVHLAAEAYAEAAATNTANWESVR